MNLAKNRYKAAIIGAGKIGALFDSPESDNVLSHAHGYIKHVGFDLVGIVDEDFEQAKRAASLWGVEAYKSLEDLFNNQHIDVVSICSSTDSHYEVLMKIKQNSSIIGGIIEKPLAGTLDQASNIVNDKFFSDRKFIVNYKRRFLPEFQEIKNKFESGIYGKLINVNILYSKGLENNASHAIDFLHFLGVKIDKIVYSNRKDNSEDYDAMLASKLGVNITIISFPSSLYKVFEIDLFFEKVRVTVQDEGFPVVELTVEEDKLFKGYFLPAKSKLMPSNADKTMSYVIDALYKNLQGDNSQICNVFDGFAAQNECAQIIKHSLDS